MPKKEVNITLEGTILREIKEQGQMKGLDWTVPRLYVTRNEQSPSNIQRKLTKLQKKNPNATEEDARKLLLFPFYSNTEGHWRRYSREEADDLIKRIKIARRYVD